jgi:hypothetical protein
VHCSKIFRLMSVQGSSTAVEPVPVRSYDLRYAPVSGLSGMKLVCLCCVANDGAGAAAGIPVMAFAGAGWVDAYPTST